MSDTLLFADDSVTMRRVVELTFAEQGLRVVSVSDGQQAIEYIASQRPSLALVSATLQKVNGFDVARFVRDHAGGRLPVLLLAGAFDTLDAAQVQESGAAGVLVKPFEPAVVIKRVKELLGMRPAPPPVTDSGRVVASDDGLSRFGEDPASSSPGVISDAREPAANDAAASARAESGSDYFDQLDAAFDSLDAQLAARPAPEARGLSAAASAQIAAVNEAVSAPSVASAFADLSAAQRGNSSHSATVPPQADEHAHNPVFEVDNDWFRPRPNSDTASEPFVITRASDFVTAPAAPTTESDRPRSSSALTGLVDEAPSGHRSPGSTEPAPSATAASTAPGAAITPDYAPSAPGAPSYAPVAASAPDTPSAPDARSAPSAPSAPNAPSAPSAPSYAPLGPADAFAMLWAQEQGEPVPAPPPLAPLELSEDTVEALSSQLTGRVADRLGAQLPGPVAATVSDRVTGAVVDRITADFDGLASRLADELAPRLAPMVVERLGDRLAAGLAERVAELTAARALEGALGEALRQTVNEVAERVVRTEIERIRAAANAKRSSS